MKLSDVLCTVFRNRRQNKESVRASWLLAVCCSTPVVVIISLQLVSTFAPRNLPPWENEKNNRNYEI